MTAPAATAGDGLREVLVESLNGTTPWVDHEGFIGRASAREIVDLHILPALRDVLAAAARDAEKVRRVESIHVSDDAETPFCDECGHAWPCLTILALDPS